MLFVPRHCYIHIHLWSQNDCLLLCCHHQMWDKILVEVQVGSMEEEIEDEIAQFGIEGWK